VLKQGLSKTKTGRPHSESRRRAATPLPRPRAAHPCPSASSPMRRLRPPAVPGRAASLGRHAPRDAPSPRRATHRRVTRAVLSGRAPLGPAVRPRPSPLVRHTTAETLTPSSPPFKPPLFKVLAFPPRAARPRSSRSTAPAMAPAYQAAALLAL
jgi:hypothetical protein